jgi:uncharacterized protein (TIGR02646 family)
MIRIRKKTITPVPAILQTKGKTATALLCERFDMGDKNFESRDFDSGIYGHHEVKDALIQIQHGKCCFCESKILHISYGDVEHYRPKAGWVQDNEKLNKPGYYWLAYEWDNLLLSCQICNQRNKKNYFPLISGSKRALSHHDNTSLEQPFFIHPVNDEVENLITFKEEIPIAVNGNPRGAETISKLGLDRELLNEQRRKTLNMVRDIYDLANGYPETFPELKQQAKEKVKKYYIASTLDETEYAAMLRAFFRDNPPDFPPKD